MLRSIRIHIKHNIVMTKKLLFASIISTLVLFSCSNTNTENLVSDGIYLIDRMDTSASELSDLKTNEVAVFFSDIFDEFNEEEYLRIIVDTSEYVPLELKGEPSTEQQTPSKKKLLLTLSNLSAEKLEAFTTKHVMKQVVMIVDGEALTKHKIREPIIGGHLQISRCCPAPLG